VLPEQSLLDSHCRHWPLGPQTGVAVGQSVVVTHCTQPRDALQTVPLGHPPSASQGTAGVPPGGVDDVEFVLPLHPHTSDAASDAMQTAAPCAKKARYLMVNRSSREARKKNEATPKGCHDVLAGSTSRAAGIGARPRPPYALRDYVARRHGHARPLRSERRRPLGDGWGKGPFRRHGRPRSAHRRRRERYHRGCRDDGGAQAGFTSAAAIASPFVFLIRNTQNGHILFMGRVEDPR
jgi:hypothetical protein